MFTWDCDCYDWGLDGLGDDRAAGASDCDDDAGSSREVFCSGAGAGCAEVDAFVSGSGQLGEDWGIVLNVAEGTDCPSPDILEDSSDRARRRLKRTCSVLTYLISSYQWKMG